MQVNINRDDSVNDYATRDITNIKVDEYSELILCLKCRLEYVEEKLEEYKDSDNKKLRSYIPRKESEIEQLKNLIKLMQ